MEDLYVFEGRTASTEDRLIDILNRAISPDTSDDEYEKLTDDAIIIIFNAGKPTFDELASSAACFPTSGDLHSILYPQTHTFKLSTAFGRVSLIPVPVEEAYSNPVPKFKPQEDEADVLGLEPSLPLYPLQDVCVEKTLQRGGSHVIARVIINDEVMLCSASSNGLADQGLECELDKLQRIRSATKQSVSPSVRVPELRAYIKHPESGRIIGLLRQWVPGCSLLEMALSSIGEDRRRSWASQIRQTVDRLHEMGIVWGDAKAANVIIGEEQDDAWLVGLAGGWTEGWVPEELADTIDGDEQGVRRIMRFIQGSHAE